MGFRDNAYATVWEVKPVSAKVTQVQLSTSRKNQEGQYETDFKGFVRFVGAATAVAASKLRERDRIKITSCEVTNRYDKERAREFTNYTVFGFERVEQNGSANTAKQKDDKSDPEPVEGGDREIPF